jgi:hypothetical protein
MDLACWLRLLHKVSTSFLVSVSGLYVLYRNYYFKIPRCLPLAKPDLRSRSRSRSVELWRRVKIFHRNPCESLIVTKREPSSLIRDSNVWLWVLCDSDHWQIALQITDPSSRQRGCPKTESKVIVREKKGKSKIWSWAPKGLLYVTSTS